MEWFISNVVLGEGLRSPPASLWVCRAPASARVGVGWLLYCTRCIVVSFVR